MPSTNHFFWSFCSQVGITMVFEGGFLGCLFSESQRCCIEILTTFPTAWTSQNRAGHSWQPKKMLRKVLVRNWKFMEGKSQELAKPRSSFTISRQRSSSSYWSCVTVVSYTAARSLFSMTCRSLDHWSPIQRLRGSATLRKVREYGEWGQVTRTIGHGWNEK